MSEKTFQELYREATARQAVVDAQSPYVGGGMMVMKCQDCGHNSKQVVVRPCELCSSDDVRLEPLTKKELADHLDLGPIDFVEGSKLHR